MSQKVDRRKKYTRMVLKDSLMKLVKNKPISNITVKEICLEADINRSTFYAHYSDQFDLLNKIEEELIEDMITALSQYNFKREEEAVQMTEKILEYIADKSEVCQTLLSENGDVYFQKRVMMIFQEYIFKNWMIDNIMDRETSKYVSLFVVSGCIQVIKTWLENSMDKPPKEMAEIINNFINKGLSSLR